VLLDFWTFCCVNCLHVIEELRAVEEKYADELVVIGVHSPKFEHEADPDALAAAVERYAVHHPVLDDPGLITWQAYTARAWPTLVLVDPEGYVVAQYAGEGHAHAIDRLLAELVEEHRAKGTLQSGDSPYVPPAAEPTTLRFPADAAPLGDGHVLVADAGHDRVVELDADGAVVREWGGMKEPNGLCVVGGTAYVADTANHQLKGIDLASGAVTVLAGTGEQWMQGDSTEHLSSPWAVAWWPRGEQSRVWIAMAGIHQLWTFDPATGAVEVAAGTTNEGLVDGPLADAWFAQTSGLAVDGDRLWLADSETSSLRWVEGGEVHTAVGQGLFDFGFRDGPAAQALLQHPLGVTVLPDGSVAVCDTYNGAVRRYEPATGDVSTLASGLAEPAAAYVDGGDLVVVEGNAHQLTRVPLGHASHTDGFSRTTQRPVTEVAAELELVVAFTPPPGQKVDDRFGPPSQLVVEATPPALLREGEGRGTDLTRRLVLDPSVGEGVLHVAARAASCDVEGDNAACHIHQQDWGVPIRITVAAEAVLTLPLGDSSAV
jgi:sugar lactone lactonase YvrE